MSGAGIKISLPGFSARRSAASESSIDTRRDLLKVDMTVKPDRFGAFKHVANITAAAVTYQVKTVEHNLGYVPVVLASIYHYEQNRFTFLPYHKDAGDFLDIGWDISTDEKKMNITFYTKNRDTTSGTQTADIRYYIFSNPST